MTFRMITFLVAAGATAFGWTASLVTNVANSAAGPGGTVVVNADIANAPGDRPTAATLYYSLDNQSSWTELAMARIGTPGYDSTWQALFPAPASGPAWYYVRATNGANLSTQSPLNAANAFPPGPELVALVADDPTGDAADPEGNWLDLTGAWVGRSGDHFYVTLTNNHTSWPTYQFPQAYFVYSLGLVNPQAPSDSWVFSMSYANVPVVFPAGLYLINRYTADFTRIGDIETSISGNRLSIRSPIAGFTGNSRFGPWPNSSGWLAAAANTQTIYPIGGNFLRDTTATARFYADRTPALVVGVNRPPVLTAPAVTPDSGSGATEFWFHAVYTDADSNLPVERSVVIDGTPHQLLNATHRYHLGAEFSTFLSGFADGRHEFFFRFGDGIDTVTSPLDTFTVGVPTAVADRGAGGPVRLRAFPNPFTTRLTFSGVAPGARVELRDAAGRLVALAPDALPGGVYFARVRGSTAPPLRLVKAGRAD